jgi:hypothetical protein
MRIAYHGKDTLLTRSSQFSNVARRIHNKKEDVLVNINYANFRNRYKFISHSESLTVEIEFSPGRPLENWLPSSVIDRRLLTCRKYLIGLGEKQLGYRLENCRPPGTLHV